VNRTCSDYLQLRSTALLCASLRSQRRHASDLGKCKKSTFSSGLLGSWLFHGCSWPSGNDQGQAAADDAKVLRNVYHPFTEDEGDWRENHGRKTKSSG